MKNQSSVPRRGFRILAVPVEVQLTEEGKRLSGVPSNGIVSVLARNPKSDIVLYAYPGENIPRNRMHTRFIQPAYMEEVAETELLN